MTLDNKITKKRVLNHLEYDFYKYILILIVSVALFIFAFYMINRTRDTEDVKLFVSGYSKKEYAFDSQALSALKKDGDRRILSVKSDFFSVTDGDFLMKFQANGVLQADILIVGETVLKQFGAGLVNLDDYILSLILPDGFEAEFYSDGGGNRRGLRVDTLKNVSSAYSFIPPVNDEEEAGGEDDYTRDTKFYLVINAKSRNIGSYSEKKSGGQQTFAVARTFLDCFG